MRISEAGIRRLVASILVESVGGDSQKLAAALRLMLVISKEIRDMLIRAGVDLNSDDTVAGEQVIDISENPKIDNLKRAVSAILSRVDPLRNTLEDIDRDQLTPLASRGISPVANFVDLAVDSMVWSWMVAKDYVSVPDLGSDLAALQVAYNVLAYLEGGEGVSEIESGDLSDAYEVVKSSISKTETGGM